MDKKVVADLKPTIRGVKQEAKRVGLAFDGIKAFASLATDSNDNEGVAVAQRELRGAITAMRSHLDIIARAIDMIADDIDEHVDIDTHNVSPDGTSYNERKEHEDVP
jgi:hypothetical protein